MTSHLKHACARTVRARAHAHSFGYTRACIIRFAIGVGRVSEQGARHKVQQPATGVVRRNVRLRICCCGAPREAPDSAQLAAQGRGRQADVGRGGEETYTAPNALVSCVCVNRDALSDQASPFKTLARARFDAMTW